MSNAGVKAIDENLMKKEVFLDRNLRPVISANSADNISTICFFYKVDGNDKKLLKISFESSDKKLPNFNIEEDIINRFLNFRRPDDKAMEILRKNSLETKSLVTLKKFAFECTKYLK